MIPLSERLSELLLALIQANGSVVDKEMLATRVWPDGGVSDANLAQHMYMLRRLLDERARDRTYVMTVRGKGYRFAAPVSVVVGDDVERAPQRREPASAKWLLQSGLDAFHHYCRGSVLVERRTAKALNEAIERFEAALSIDANYVPALIGLARAYALLAAYWYAPGSYAYPKAKASVLHALELEPASGPAHAVLSQIFLFCDWDWHEADREIATAIALAPDSSLVRNNLVWHSIFRGRPDAAVREAQLALACEPASPTLQLLMARVFLHAGDLRQSIASFTNLIDAGPEFAVVRRHRAQAYILNGQPAEALNDLLLLPSDRAEDVGVRLPMLARAYADCGDALRALDVYDTLKAFARTEFVLGWNLAIVAIGLGRYDEAFQYLERALERREPSLMLLRSLPFFEPISRRARFRSLLEAIEPP